MPTGRIKYYNLDKGFGFIAQDSSEEDVFLHSSAIKYAECDELRVGQRVKYSVVEGEKGLVAKNVEVLLTPTERRWLRQGKTIIPRGYSGFPSHNQFQYMEDNKKKSEEDQDADINKQKLQERSQPHIERTSKNKDIDSKNDEESSRQLSYGDLYILKQINFETPMFFALYNHEHIPAIVLEMTLAGLTLNYNGNEKVVPKTEVKYCYKDVDAEKVTSLLQYNEDVKEQHLKPIVTENEEELIELDMVYQNREDSNTIEIVLREGEIFQGKIDWISPYEVKMVLKNGSKVVIFRHAIFKFSIISAE